MEDALTEITTMLHVAGIPLINNKIPDMKTIRNYWHLYGKNKLEEEILHVARAHLMQRGMTMKQGTIIDDTLN